MWQKWEAKYSLTKYDTADTEVCTAQDVLYNFDRSFCIFDHLYT